MHGKMGLLSTYPGSHSLNILCPDNLVAFNIGYFWLFPNPLEDCVCESSSIALDMTIVYVTNPAFIVKKGILGVCHLEEVIVIAHNRLRRVLLQYDNIRIVDKPVGSLVFFREDRCKNERRTLAGVVLMIGREWSGQG